MSNFTPLVNKTYEFDGDTVNVQFRRLNRKHMLAAMPAFKKLRDAEGSDDNTHEAINDLLNDIADLLPEYVTTFEGLNDANNNVVGIETVINEMYFMRLCALIAVDVMRESSVSGGKS